MSNATVNGLDVAVAQSPKLNATILNRVEVGLIAQHSQRGADALLKKATSLFWHNYTAEACHEIIEATRLAVDLGMFRREFAANHGGTDTVLRECWRQTWWTLYIVCGYVAGTLGTLDFAVLDIEVTVELPCEEAEYEMGLSTASDEQIPLHLNY
ncbi:hypothetical protein MKX08_007233 [Trichoderma sp. CBMAI-0020]|nr:hypothetical protein MKX08_007233 [Trichoderma sp. CBMAI-0020]